MLRIIGRLWELPPRESFRKAVRILTGKRGRQDIEEIVKDPKLMRSQRFYDFFSRYEAILARQSNWQPIDFNGKRVLEIGCGPQLGFGPLALFRGAASYSSMDPVYDPEVLNTPSLVNTYYLNAFKDLSGVYGPVMDFEQFLTSLREKSHIVSETLIGTSLKGPFDIVISNSCLEHIFDFSESMKVLHQLSAPDARFVHLVDFGTHRNSRNPFEGLFSMHPDEYLKRHDNAINLLRGPDILREMQAIGFEVAMTPYYSFPEFFEGDIHPYWSEKYSPEELFLKTAIFHDITSDTL
jgi:SAM-dependent methyltransferase